MIRVHDIMMWRDGGTITFTVEGDNLSGRYRLRTPIAGEPRLLFRDDVQVPIGGEAEAVLTSALKRWLSFNIDDENALARLGELHEWRNLPEDLARVVPLYRIRSVIRYLEANPSRNAAKS
jgi:hypothetical protein